MTMGKLLVFLEIPVLVFEFQKRSSFPTPLLLASAMLVVVVLLQAFQYRTVFFVVVLVRVGLVVVSSGAAEVVHVQVCQLDSQ